MIRLLPARLCHAFVYIFLFMAIQVHAQNPLAPALNFNLFLQNGATLVTNETEGPIAMGGDLTIAGTYTVSTNYKGTYTVSGVPVTLLIGGKVNYQSGSGVTVNQNGYVKIGSSNSSYAWYKDQNYAYSPMRVTPGSYYYGTPKISMQANSQQLGVSSYSNPIFQGNLIDFTSAFTQMKTSSLNMSSVTDNTSLTNSNGTAISHTNLPTQVKVNLAWGTNTLNLTGTDINKVQDFIYNTKPDANHVLIVNVNAPGTFTWAVYNSSGISFSNCPFILYNFYNTTALYIGGNGAVEGTIFAPLADITKTTNQSDVEGQIVAKSYYHSGGETHYPPFNANVPTCVKTCNISLSGTQTNLTCNGAANGSINVSVSGNSGTTTYSWNDGIKTEDRSGLAAGTYTVTATDASNCSVSKSFTVTQPSALAVTATQVNVSTSGGSNGSINITVSGGTSPYTYKWNDGITTEDRTGLTAGTYSVTITDKNSCTKACTYTITQPSCNINVTSTYTNVTCNGGTNGSINLSTSGCSGSITYLWNDGVKTQDRTGLAAGTYTVTITDEVHCSTTKTFTITQPTAIAVTATQVNVTTNGGNNGSINITVSGGTSPYTYRWNDGVTTEDRSSLRAGTYSVTVTDKNGCTKGATYTITQPPACNINLTGTYTDVTCNGAANGSINITVSGCTGTITYTWNDGIKTEDRTGLAPGTYTVTVTDGVNCSATKTFTISQPTAVTITATQVNVTTNGGTNGSINITVSGGTSPYTYKWNDGVITEDRTALPAGTYSVTVTDKNGCSKGATYTITQPSCNISIASTPIDVTCNGSANGSININVSGCSGTITYLWNDGVKTEDRAGLAPGTYTVTVTDGINCSATKTFTISQPTAVAITATQINVTTDGGTNGSINLTISGGTPPYTYLWNDGATTEDRTGLAAGTYSVTVTDKNGCSKGATYTITQPFCNISVAGGPADVTCNGSANGSIDVTVSSNSGAVGYAWNDGATTEDRSGLAPGTYSITVTDAINCSAGKSFTIQQPDAVSISGIKVDVSTNGGSDGSIDITVSGGTSPYTYLWNDGATTEDRTGLAAGTYSVTVTDKNGCSKGATYVITQPSCNISVAGTPTDVTCNGAVNGSVDVTVSGNSGAVNYAWNDGATTEDRTGLAPGTYSITVTDAINCSAGKTFKIEQPDAVSISGIKVDVSTNGGSDGSIDITVSGGTSPYSYMWNDGATTEDRTGLAAGTYSVTVTDKNGCSKGATYTITQPEPCNIKISKCIVTDVSCNGANDGAIDITVKDATGSVTYLWNDGATTEDRTGLAPGNYTVVATDSKGCTATKSAKITQPKVLKLTVTVTPQTTRDICDGTATVTVSGGTPPYTITWSDGYIGGSRTGICTGTYTITVTDANGCSVYQIVKIPLQKPGYIVKSSETSTLSIATTKDLSISVAPNPAKSVVKVTVSTNVSSPAVLKLYDLTGKLLLSYKMNLSAGFNYKDLDISSLAHGIYELQLISNNKTKVVRIAKQ